MTLFWGELTRRNVVRVAIAYAVVSWLLLQVADVVLDNIEAPTWVFQAILLLLVIGFPVAIIFAWAFELTPEGLKKEKDVDRSESITNVTGRKLDFVIIGVLVIAVGFLLVDKLYLSEGDTAPDEIIATERKSIAVLPFVNMSDDANNEYFSDGISEEILNLLTQVPEMRVTSRSSAFSFKGQNVDIPTIAARLNVAHVLEGSVRKSDNQLRITAQLIEVDADTHLWSETYNREFEDIFAIQDEIAAAVVDALKITLLGKKLKATETDPEAYALYLQGLHLSKQGTAESSKQAETLLKQALAINSDFAPAWTELGAVYQSQTSIFALRPADEGNELARDAIQRSLDKDPQHARAYAILARVEMYYDWDFVMASQHLRQALALSPGDALILMYAADMNKDLGRIDEAIELYRQSIALDPVSPAGHQRQGLSLLLAHRLEEAADSLQMALSLSPGLVGAQYFLGLVLLAQADAQAALVAMEQEASDVYRLIGTAVAQQALGDAGASDAALKELIENWAAEAAFQVAEIYAFRGDSDNAFDWLEQAYDNRDSGLTSMMVSPLLTNLHNDPRWEPFLDKMGLPH
jgi:adenylate cyclase